MHRFEYYFVYESRTNNKLAPLCAPLLFRFFPPFSSTLCSLHNFRIQDSVGYHPFGADRHSAVVVHRCTQNAICVFRVCERNVVKSVDSENGLWGATQRYNSIQSASTEIFTFSRSFWARAERMQRTLKWHKQFRVHVKIHKFRFLHAIHKVMYSGLLLHHTKTYLTNEHTNTKKIK